MANLLRYSVVYHEILTKSCEEFSYGNFLNILDSDMVDIWHKHLIRPHEGGRAGFWGAALAGQRAR